jgi:hypothetical protein
MRVLVSGPSADAWLVQFAAPSNIDDRRRMHLVALAIVKGDFDGAGREAALLRDRDLTRIAERAIQIRSGNPPLDGPAASYGQPEDSECPFAAAISESWRTRDGAPIAAVVRRKSCHLDLKPGALENVFDVIPSLSNGQAALAEAIRTHPQSTVGHPSFVGITANVLPAARAADASVRRDLARLLGDRAEQERQSAIVERAIAALSTRERVLAFRQLERGLSASSAAPDPPTEARGE